MKDEKLKRQSELFAVGVLEFILQNTSQPIITANIAMLPRLDNKQITTDPAIGEKIFGIDAAIFMVMRELGSFETVTEKFNENLGVGRLDTTFADLIMYKKIMEPSADYFTVTIDRKYAEILIERVRSSKNVQKKQFIIPPDPEVDDILEIRFDTEKGEIIIGEKRVSVPANTHQFEVCSVILKNISSQKKVWEYDEIEEKFNPKLEKNTSISKYYGAIDQVNLKVAIETGTKDFFIKIKPKTKKFQLNPKFI